MDLKRYMTPYNSKHGFVLDGTNISYHLPSYNPLKDAHLSNYFLNEKMRQHLESMGIISNDG